VLIERREHVQEQLDRIGTELPASAYIFTHDPLGAAPWDPSWVTKKVSDVASAAGVIMNVKSLRHYSASQLLAGGIDLRNTAARLGHGGGGATTLRHYADPVSEVDRRAAAYLARLTAPAPGSESVGWPGASQPRAPTESVRDSLPSYGSCRPGHLAAGFTQAQCAKYLGRRAAASPIACIDFFQVLSFLYLFMVHRSR